MRDDVDDETFENARLFLIGKVGAVVNEEKLVTEPVSG
jgi:hypothetical protein